MELCYWYLIIAHQVKWMIYIGSEDGNIYARAAFRKRLLAVLARVVN